VSEYYKLNEKHLREYRLAYAKNNKGKCNANTAKRKAAKLQRTPSWLTKEQWKEIRQFYIEAKELSWLSQGGLDVDHIVPLQGKDVSGLHVPWNLQIIPSPLNKAKSNKLHSKITSGIWIAYF
jgi:5-methylcytosine-specific restriction endonuclease McrA